MKRTTKLCKLLSEHKNYHLIMQKATFIIFEDVKKGLVT